MHVTLQLLHALLQRLALTAKLVQMLAFRAQPLVGALLRARRPGEGKQHEQRQGQQARYTPRRCLPTESALPTSPMSPPHTTPMIATLRSKNVVCRR